MTRSGHISSPRKQSMNESLGRMNWIQEKAAALALLLVARLRGWGEREEDQWRIRGSWIGTWVWVGAADPPCRADGFLPRLGRRAGHALT